MLPDRMERYIIVIMNLFPIAINTLLTKKVYSTRYSFNLETIRSSSDRPFTMYSKIYFVI